MKSKIHLFTVENAKIIKSKRFGRYGLLLHLSYKRQEKLYLIHTFWFGNYKDFNEDLLNKSTLIWDLTLTKFEKMGFPEKAYENPNILIGKTFFGVLGVNDYGVYLDKICSSLEE